MIAIDTSGSCSGETVQRFLGETYGILSEKRIFQQDEGIYRPVRLFYPESGCDPF